MRPPSTRGPRARRPWDRARASPPIRARVQPLRQIAVDRIVRRGLVGDDVGPHAAAHQFGKDIGGVAEQADRDRLPVAAGFFDDRQRLVEIVRLHVEIAGAQAHLDAARLAFDREARSAGHRGGERLRAAHAAKTGGQDPAAGEIAAIMLAADFDEGLVGALNDALGADIDPRAGGHLAVHHQALAIELVEMIPGRPVRHEVGIGDQHARRVGMGAEHADRLARLDEQGLVGLQPLQRGDDLGRTPSSRARRGRCRRRRPARPAFRRRRDRDCSSACAAALRSASSWRRARGRAARG